MDKRCRKVVDLQLKSEAADRSVDSARERQLADALEGRMAAEVRLEEAQLEHLRELDAQNREMRRMCEEHRETIKTLVECCLRCEDYSDRVVEHWEKVERDRRMRWLWEEGIL